MPPKAFFVCTWYSDSQIPKQWRTKGVRRGGSLRAHSNGGIQNKEILKILSEIKKQEKPKRDIWYNWRKN